MVYLPWVRGNYLTLHKQYVAFEKKKLYVLNIKVSIQVEKKGKCSSGYKKDPNVKKQDNIKIKMRESR